jgi:hypothetical protein
MKHLLSTEINDIASHASSLYTTIGRNSGLEDFPEFHGQSCVTGEGDWL